MNEVLRNDLQFLKGVGPKRAELLFKELEMETFEDLLYYVPYKYIDRSRIFKISEIDSQSAFIQLQGKITSFEVVGFKRHQRLVAKFTDGTGSIELVWFQGIKWIKNAYKLDHEYIVFGKPVSFKGKYNIPHPEMDEAEKADSGFNASLQGMYSLTEKLKDNSFSSRVFQKLIFTLLESHGKSISETLPEFIVKKMKMLSITDALKTVHFPADTKELERAINRLKFEELFYIQLNILKQKYHQKENTRGLIFPKVGHYVNECYRKYLPFNMTNAQKRVIKEIHRDMQSGKQMNRLLQGDVGSGKTLVAIMTMLIALDNDFQSCIMAPTEILATQHFLTFRRMLGKLNITVGLLTGSTTQKQRKIILEDLNEGSIKILIGTHALLEDVVQFKNLGLVVIDEQHKFGVAQRAELWKKNVNPPHILVMTATPIPRTLAMTIYGDLDVSVIDELPVGRKPIKTFHLNENKRQELYKFISKEINAGRQIYIIYPLIKESEKLDYKNLEDGFKHIQEVFKPLNYNIDMVHGRMKTEDKDNVMQRFKEGEINILVCTTVIEVGVDVPNASVMVIESSERFGLSQLHQLRGRVGRGSQQSYCILMTSHKLTKDAKTRLRVMTDTSDGFVIAEEDLKLRGPGELEGTQQSGMPFNLRVANLARDGQILQIARDTATEILDKDHELQLQEHKILKYNLERYKKDSNDWGKIS